MTSTTHIPWSKLPQTITIPIAKNSNETIQCIIRHPTLDDVVKLSKLEYDTFYNTFINQHNNTELDVKLYCDTAFNIEQQTNEIESSNQTTMIVERIDNNELIGYSMLKHNSTEPCCHGQLPNIEFQRCYIDSKYHGIGLAHILFNLNIEYSINVLHVKSMWLGVWEYNYKAIRFYEKIGLKHVGSHRFMFGNDPQTDYIYEMSLL